MKHRLLKKPGSIKVILVGIIIIVVVAIAGAGGYYWWKGTPTYSMHQLAKAIQDKNVEAAEIYIDYDSIFDSLWQQVTAEANAQLTKNNQDDPFASLGTVIGLGILNEMKPALKEDLRTTIEAGIRGDESSTSTEATTTNQSLLSLKSGNYSIVKGNETYIPLDNGVKLILRQSPDRHWMISEIEGLDLSDSSESDASSSTNK